VSPGDSVDSPIQSASSTPGDTVESSRPELGIVSVPSATTSVIVEPSTSTTVLAGVVTEQRGKVRLEPLTDNSCSSRCEIAPSSVETPKRGNEERGLASSSSDYSASSAPEEGSERGEEEQDADEDEAAIAIHSFLASLTTPPAPESTASSTASSSRKKRKNRRPKSKAKEPEVAASPLTVEVFLDGEKGVALTDSGSQADVLSSEFALRIGCELRRLTAPIHADLGSDGHSVRLAVYTAIPCSVGSVEYASRSFFVAPLPPGIDAILGVPWMRDSNVGISSSSLFFVPTDRPNEEFYDFKTGRFALQPQANLADLGFVKRPMTAAEQNAFVLCALVANVPGLEDYVDWEPPNPLLDDWTDDPNGPDLSKDEAAAELKTLKADFADIFVKDLPQLPPFRPVNHDIHEIIKGLKIPARVIGMPDRYQKQWTAHLLQFVESGFWSPRALDSACAMFSVPKADPSKARFVINLKPRNANTVKTASPIPDMRSVRANLAAHPIRSKLDFKAAYEQIRLNADSVSRSGFVTKNGTFVSRVMQQGDCNAPDTMHRVCYMMFSRAMGRFLDTFYDDLFVYSHTRRAHLRYLRIVFDTLRHYKFYLAEDKVELMTERMEALGAVVSDDGIEVEPSRWDSIKDWPRPRSPKDVLRFMGVAQWMSDHLPHLNELAAPLTRLTGKVDWNWTAACETSFEAIKALIPEKLVPLDLRKLESGEEQLFLFTDASMVGCGGWIGQGTCIENARPFRFHSSKFNPAQVHYTTTDQELLAVLDSCLKFRDHLIGWRFTVVCDHEPLKTYHSQPPKQTRRHVRLWETLSLFDFDWKFIEGKKNVIADSLSRLAELMVEEGTLHLKDAREPDPNGDAPFPTEPSRPPDLARTALISAIRTVSSSAGESSLSSSPSSLSSSLNDARVVLTTSLPQEFVKPLPDATRLDSLGRKVVANPAAFPSFVEDEGLLFLKDDSGLRLFVPKGLCNGDDETAPSFVEAVLKMAHETVGHQGAAKTLAWARRFFWWPLMHRDAHDYVAGCEPCCRGKSVPAKPFGLLHPLPIPSRPWSTATIDFVVSLPPVKYQNAIVDSILTATCPFSKMVILMPLPSTATAEQVSQVVFDSVYRRFGSPVNLVSDRDPKFTSDFWRSYNKKVGTKLLMSTSAHPQTDGRSEVTNKTVGQVLRIVCADAPTSWPDKITSVEFALNSAASSATSLSPFEVVYGFLPSSWPVDTWSSSVNAATESRTEQAKLDWLRVTDAIIASRIDMAHEANKHRRDDSEAFSVGGKAYLSSSGIRFPPGLPAKFVPRFLGPFDIVSAHPSSSNYTLALPPHLHIHPNPEPVPVIAGADAAEDEWEVEKVVAVKEVRKRRLFRVRYRGYSAATDEWRPEDELRDTAPDALDAFLAQHTAAEAAKAAKVPGRRSNRIRLSAFLSSFSKLTASSQTGVGARNTSSCCPER
jgi:hypothetical protein